MTTKTTRIDLPDDEQKTDLLHAIVDELDQAEWTADTMERIATKLRRAGYTIRDLKEEEE